MLGKTEGYFPLNDKMVFQAVWLPKVQLFRWIFGDVSFNLTPKEFKAVIEEMKTEKNKSQGSLAIDFSIHVKNHTIILPEVKVEVLAQVIEHYDKVYENWQSFSAN